MYTLNYNKRNTLVDFWYGDTDKRIEISIWELFNQQTPYFGFKAPIVEKYPDLFIKVNEGDLPDTIKYRYNIIPKI